MPYTTFQQQLITAYSKLNPGWEPPPPPAPTRRKDVYVSNAGLGWISFISYNFEGYVYPQYSFTCLLGDGAPEVKDGYGGWQPVSRARAVAFTQWNGRNPLTIDIPILFDAWAAVDKNAGIRIENDIRQLEKMAGNEFVYKDNPDRQPPLVLVDSNGVVPHDFHDASQNDFVIADIQWGDSDRNEYGNRVRQAATITIMEYVYDAVIGGSGLRPSPTSKNAAKKGAKVRYYKVAGPKETLRTIAHHKLGNSNYWRHIRDANRDPKTKKPRFKSPHTVIPAGTILVLPMKIKKKK